MTNRNITRLDGLVKKAESVLGQSLDTLWTVVERWTSSTVLTIMEDGQHREATRVGGSSHCVAGLRNSRNLLSPLQLRYTTPCQRERVN